MFNVMFGSILDKVLIGSHIQPFQESHSKISTPIDESKVKDSVLLVKKNKDNKVINTVVDLIKYMQKEFFAYYNNPKLSEDKKIYGGYLILGSLLYLKQSSRQAEKWWINGNKVQSLKVMLIAINILMLATLGTLINWEKYQMSRRSKKLSD